MGFVRLHELSEIFSHDNIQLLWKLNIHSTTERAKQYKFYTIYAELLNFSSVSNTLAVVIEKQKWKTFLLQK